jgi:UDP-glucose 4-epimerase
LITAFEQACGKALPKHLGARRVGDVASFYANASKAGKQLEWQAHRTPDGNLREHLEMAVQSAQIEF